MRYDVIVIGGGVIGAMVLRALSRYRLSICMAERENDPARGASGANSGIVHAGFDAAVGTLKAKLNTAGVEKLFQAARELNVPHWRNGSMVCAFSDEENQTLAMLYERGLQNGIPGMQLLSGDEARALEPALSDVVTQVLLVTNARIICPYQLTIAAVGNAMDNGVELRCNFAVQELTKIDGQFEIRAESGDVLRSRYLVNCAGCYSDKIAAMAGDDYFHITPRAGEYMLMDKAASGGIAHTLFQVPGKEGKGILVSPTADGNLLVGPTASQVQTPECRDTTREGLDLVRRLASKTVPTLDYRHVITSFTGVRATGSTGDFILEESGKLPGLIHAAGVESPGLTCCVSIAEYLSQLLKQAGLELQPRADWNGRRENPHAFREMNDEEKDAYIRQHPEYGRIVCRCEGVSEGEIRTAIRQNPPARDIDGVKRRTRSGMGRCQGGFCGPYVMELLAEEMGVPMEAVTKSGGASYMLTGKVGE